MGDLEDMVSEWSWEENKRFELALAVVDERDPERWEVVAAMVGGRKSAKEVERHYMILLEDLHFIESGHLDYKLEIELEFEDDCSYVQVDHTKSLYLTDEDHKLLLQLDIS